MTYDPFTDRLTESMDQLIARPQPAFLLIPVSGAQSTVEMVYRDLYLQAQQANRPRAQELFAVMN